jgi:malonyl CoA-acyl carrier protein transacylase
MKPSAMIHRQDVAVVGLGIRGLGLDGVPAFIERLRNLPVLDAFGGDAKPDLLAQAAAGEALADMGGWSGGRSALFLSLPRDPGRELAGLARFLEQRYELKGRGSVSHGDEMGGSLALESALRRIEAGALDCALVGAVQAWPVPAVPDGLAPSQGLAVFLAIRRRDAAERLGCRIWAVLGPGPARRRRTVRLDPVQVLGDRGEIVAGLVQVAAGLVMSSAHAWRRGGEERWEPLLDRTDGSGFALAVATPGGGPWGIDLWRPFQPGPGPLSMLPAPGLLCYAGDSLGDLHRRVALDERGGNGPVRMAALVRDGREREALAARLDRSLGPLTPAGWLEPMVFYSPAPIRGKVACLFTPPGSGYPGMGRDLLLGMPFLPKYMRGLRDLSAAEWIYGTGPDRRGDPVAEWMASLLLSQAHAAFTRDILGIRPQVALGLSLGEAAALMAYGAWDGAEGELERIRVDRAYVRLLSSPAEAARVAWGLPEGTPVQWRTWTVFGPVGRVLERAEAEQRAFVSMVYSPVHCILAGEAEACRRVMAGVPELTAFLATGSALHTPVMAAGRNILHRHLCRPTRRVPGIQFHSTHHQGAYLPGPDRSAEAMASQAAARVDVPAAAWQAWDAGARIFIEHGPRSLLTSALARVLPRREGAFLALDVLGENSFLRALKVAAELWCRGVPVDLAGLEAALGCCPGATPRADLHLEVAASLFAASLRRTGSLAEAYRACLRDTQGRFLEVLGLSPGED